MTFDPNDFFTFLWPEKWSAKSSLSFVLVAVNKGQTVEEALSDNKPIVQENDIRSYYVQYPCDAPPLVFGEYAWQIKNADGKTLLTTHFVIGEVNSSGYEISTPQNVWMYTGYTFDEIKDDKILDFVDVVVDGEYIEAQRNTDRQWVGSENQVIWRKNSNGEWIPDKPAYTYDKDVQEMEKCDCQGM